MTESDIHHLAAAYALDALDPEERRVFEAHYPDCPVCRADVLDHRDTLAAVAAVSPITPSPVVRDRVLDEIARTRQLSPLVPDDVVDLRDRRATRSLRTAAMAVAAAVVLVVGGFVVTSGPGGPDVADELTAVVAASDGRVVTLEAAEGLDVAGTVRVAWSASTGRAVVVGDGLPPAPDGQAYELWLLDDAGPPVPMRLLDVASDGSLRRSLPLDGVPDGWGITIEAASGSDTPTPPIRFVASA